ncbi:prolipoprotein diacylglyceryl transferase [Streptosporangium sp. NPDC050855]|uniref:prolipoprotein diacylglyceryl transferase n=1 Tax=Streptosporangium sp. NPDC050855 TaxID=3366194 RepID=UPI0037B049EB
MPLASIPSPSQGVWHLFGVVPIRAYALCIVLGVVVAVVIGERRWRARGGQPGTIVDLAVWAVPFGLVGGRIYHVLTDWQLYFGADAPNEPYEALFIWNGGLGIWGAVALGGVGVWIACRRAGLSLTAVADTIAPGIVIAQGIGRWGNYFNQELFGSPTDLPWGLEIDPDRPGTVPGEDTYHPAFLYESIWDLGLGVILIWAGSRFALRHGRLFALYVAGYTVGRFWIEGLRVDTAHHILGLRLNQWTSIIVFIGAMIYFWYARNRTDDEPVLPAGTGGGVPDGAVASDEDREDHENPEDLTAGGVREGAGDDTATGTPPGGGTTGTTGTSPGTTTGTTGTATALATPGEEGLVDPAHPSDQAEPAEKAVSAAAREGTPASASSASVPSPGTLAADVPATPADPASADPAHPADQAEASEIDGPARTGGPATAGGSAGIAGTPGIDGPAGTGGSATVAGPATADGATGSGAVRGDAVPAVAGGDRGEQDAAETVPEGGKERR